MKKLVFLLAIAAAGFYGYLALGENPSEISTPTYLESRVSINIPEADRELEVAVVGEMASENDCENRKGRYLENLFENCPNCAIKFTECKPEIQGHLEELFLNGKSSTTYLSLTKGNRFERNVRLVVWGLNDQEANSVCSEMKKIVATKYSGTAECI